MTTPSQFTPAAPTPEMGDALALRVLRVLAFEYCRDAFWREDEGILSMSINCSDVFVWGGADCETITDANIDLLEATFAECEAVFGKYNADSAAELFVARARGIRPQGAFYADLGSQWQALFDACGPERSVGLGNPMTPQQAKDRARIRRDTVLADAMDRS